MEVPWRIGDAMDGARGCCGRARGCHPAHNSHKSQRCEPFQMEPDQWRHTKLPWEPGRDSRWPDVALGQHEPGGGHLPAPVGIGRFGLRSAIIPTFFSPSLSPFSSAPPAAPRLKEPIPRPDSPVPTAQLPGSRPKTTVGLARQWEHVGSPAPQALPWRWPAAPCCCRGRHRQVPRSVARCS